CSPLAEATLRPARWNHSPVPVTYAGKIDVAPMAAYTRPTTRPSKYSQAKNICEYLGPSVVSLYSGLLNDA
ncbi:MAG: hypothetical protein ONB15_06500, partial [candidate division KSB1 bacterium]|nr:hypothetical protein [candidate division KSB1 bacterium]